MWLGVAPMDTQKTVFELCEFAKHLILTAGLISYEKWAGRKSNHLRAVIDTLCVRCNF